MGLKHVQYGIVHSTTAYAVLNVQYVLGFEKRAHFAQNYNFRYGLK